MTIRTYINILTEAESSKESLFELEDEIKFWSHQLSEHALFLHQGIEEETLKKRGLELHKKWEKFRESDQSVDKIIPLMKDLRDYKVEIITRLNKGEWLGWMFVSLVEHILRELDYLQEKIDGKIRTKREELDFWKIINADHADFTAHLLDINEIKLIEAAMSSSKNLRKTTTIDSGLEQSKQLDKFVVAGAKGIKNNKIKSVIPQALIDHIEREGKRSIETLEKFK